MTDRTRKSEVDNAEHDATVAQLTAELSKQIAFYRSTAACHTRVIDQLFLRAARFQARWNTPYAQYLLAQEIDIDHISVWSDIPPVPTSAFKDAELATFAFTRAERVFWTSGTTAVKRGRHAVFSLELYRQAAIAAFERLVLIPCGHTFQSIKIINGTPNPHEQPRSSLGTMVQMLMDETDRPSVSLLKDEFFHTELLRREMHAARKSKTPICLFTTAIGLSHFLTDLAETSAESETALPPGSIIIETGGFKGRNIQLDRLSLYALASQIFHIPQSRILAELGMTELLSQYYDKPTDHVSDLRIKIAPPWLRHRIVDAQGRDCEPGVVGTLCHYDLANLTTVVAIETEDLAVQSENGFIFIGRQARAELRGCSLTAEDLRRLVREGS